ncbi:hypothetical protein A2U01_0050705, partial [Trifolium medium]|nr:hypothetical protein [Trifolium medium]
MLVKLLYPARGAVSVGVWRLVAKKLVKEGSVSGAWRRIIRRVAQIHQAHHAGSYGAWRLDDILAGAWKQSHFLEEGYKILLDIERESVSKGLLLQNQIEESSSIVHSMMFSSPFYTVYFTSS